MRRFLAVAVLLAAAACSKVVSEELPGEPSDAFASPIPQQVTVVPVLIPSPQPGGAPPPPAPQPVPAPTSNPTPRPSAGAPTPAPGSGGGSGSVARVGAKVFFLECNGAIVPDTDNARTAQVGCRIHYDCTPRDAANNPTTARGTPVWTWSPTSLIRGGGSGGNPYTPAVEAVSEGTLTASVVIDGVRSDDVVIRIVR